MVKNILSQLKDKIKYLKPNELVTVKRAIDFAGLAHDGQKRLSGDPYFRHPLEVASAVADLKLDADAITAAVLHDTVEDTGIHINEIKKKFIEKCGFKNCVIKRDAISKETEINYIISSPTPDEQNIFRIDYHIVWFEDEESVKVKTEYLKEQGIGSVSYWASGYF